MIEHMQTASQVRDMKICIIDTFTDKNAKQVKFESKNFR